MKLILTVSVEHDLLDVPTLLLAMPAALGAARTGLSAGIEATGPNGMTIQAPGTGALATVRFRLDYAESAAATLPSAANGAADDPAPVS